VSVFGIPHGDGSPYIEAVDGTYYFVVEERGIEYERRRTVDLGGLLYWIFEGVTFSLSCDFELRHRRPDEDFQRQLFSKQEALLTQLSPNCGDRKAEEHRRIPMGCPFDDCG
jgi:hypothetical protein